MDFDTQLNLKLKCAAEALRDACLLMHYIDAPMYLVERRNKEIGRILELIEQAKGQDDGL